MHRLKRKSRSNAYVDDRVGVERDSTAWIAISLNKAGAGHGYLLPGTRSAAGL